MDAHRNVQPRHLEVAQQIAHDHVLPQIAADHGHVIDALEALWPSLVELSSPE